MREKLLIIGCGFILLNCTFCGCQENQTNEVTFEGIELQSEVVELVNASLDFTYNEFNEIEKVEVQYLFHNIADRLIKDLKVTVEFYDANNKMIAASGEKHILNLPENYTEKTLLEANKIHYEGLDAYLINHVKIIAVEV